MIKTGFPKTRIGCGALALAAAVAASAAMPGIAAAQQPQENRVWAQCTLNGDTVSALLQDMNASSGQLTPNEVAFVVVYSFQENDGQPRSTGGFTGPVLCRNTDVVPSIGSVLQTDNIGTNGAPVDVLDLENAIILRYQRSGTTDVEKRYCHTVDANTDCFRLF